ncbi:hypothetical protein Pint_04725 [Pistacia integerrima]|uniref:Uncharacterized protein n=1 Tax=Pistacia integerrima TaxID=434235 RepID=A0ACC0Z785_9ROSI|nr:hypothetical protein Pint_04725 [Pistacia integerrima]
MKPQRCNFKFNLFGIDCEIRNVDPGEFSYIVLIKDIKKYVARENEEVNLYLDEKFKVEAMLPMSREKYLLNSDNDVRFILEQYGLKGVLDIQLFVEVLPIETVEPLLALLDPNDKQPEVP